MLKNYFTNALRLLIKQRVYAFINILGLRVVEGRSFLPTDLQSDPLPVIVSKGYAQAMSDGASVVGTRMTQGGGGEIIGVVDEFQNASFTSDENVAVLQLDPTITRFLVVKLNGGRVQEGIEVLQEAWKSRSPDRPMVWQFLDDRIQQQYIGETRFGSIFTWFSGLSLAIAVFGLTGLASLSARQRDKEIAIRKSLGASESSILLLLNREFLFVVLGGMLLAAPLAFIYSRRWLEGFSQRIDVGGEPFVWAAVACLVFVLLSVNLQSFRAARANPVDALKWD